MHCLGKRFVSGLFTLFFSEDSNDHLTTQDLMSLPTSTPVQV